LDWDGRIEPKFDIPRRSRRQRTSTALVPVPPPVDAFVDLLPTYDPPADMPATEIDYAHLKSRAWSPFSAFCIVAITIGVFLFGLSHAGPQFWESVGIGLAWIAGVAALVGFIALMTAFPNLARAVLAVSLLIVAIGWFFQEDRYSRRRWDD
jgi:hypothetical protein